MNTWLSENEVKSRAMPIDNDLVFTCPCADGWDIRSTRARSCSWPSTPKPIFEDRLCGETKLRQSQGHSGECHERLCENRGIVDESFAARGEFVVHFLLAIAHYRLLHQGKTTRPFIATPVFVSGVQCMDVASCCFCVSHSREPQSADNINPPFVRADHLQCEYLFKQAEFLRASLSLWVVLRLILSEHSHKTREITRTTASHLLTSPLVGRFVVQTLLTICI